MARYSVVFVEVFPRPQVVGGCLSPINGWIIVCINIVYLGEAREYYTQCMMHVKTLFN